MKIDFSKKKNIWIAAILGVLLWLMAIQFTRVFINIYEAQVAFKSFTTRLVAKDYHGAYALTDSDFRSVTSEAEFTTQQSFLSNKLGNLKEVSQTSFNLNLAKEGWQDVLSAHFIFGDAERDFDFTLKKAGKTWQVHGYRELE